jgi:hypothetical protein
LPLLFATTRRQLAAEKTNCVHASVLVMVVILATVFLGLFLGKKMNDFQHKE